MKSVLISIHPKWCEKILSGEKTIEVRKTAPKEVPFKVYIYETKAATETPWADEDGHLVFKGRGKVIGEFICDSVTKYPYELIADGSHLMPYGDLEKTCLDGWKLYDYLRGKDGYGWHISGLKFYDKPKRLSEFYAKCTVSDKKCRLCENCYNRENPYGRDYAVKKIARPPQNYMFIDDL